MLDPMSSVTLREVTRETVRDVLRLEVSPEQTRFVANNAVSIAQAHFSPEAWFRAIYADDEPVGFLMLSDKPEEPEYFLWRLMLGVEHQGKGYGQQALELLVEHVRGRPGATELLTSVVQEEGSPQPFYEAFGFVSTGLVEDGELVLRYTL